MRKKIKSVKKLVVDQKKNEKQATEPDIIHFEQLINAVRSWECGVGDRGSTLDLVERYLRVAMVSNPEAKTTKRALRYRQELLSARN